MVNVQGTVFDRNEPPGPSRTISDPLGAKLILSPDSSKTGFNAALFTENPASPLFQLFQFPGKAVATANATVPVNAFTFQGTVQNGQVAGDLFSYAGYVETGDGQKSYLYAGSWDNPINGGFDATPAFSWDYASDGIVGNGDNQACLPAQGPLPSPGFIVVVERGGCLFWQKAYNAALAGASAVVVFNYADGGDTFVPNMVTPGANIPSVFLRRSDGLDLLNYADNNRAMPGTVAINPNNLMGSLMGTYTTDVTGTVVTMSLSFYISDWNNSIFTGTLTK